MIPLLYRMTLTGAPHENCSFIQRQKTAVSDKAWLVKLGSSECDWTRLWSCLGTLVNTL